MTIGVTMPAILARPFIAKPAACGGAISVVIAQPSAPIPLPKKAADHVPTAAFLHDKHL
ncbi:hypothetical protein [Nocardia alni]|uniref:hypothetical protein n=1 Tax=Nocardia alni TaxID=2815723 RepID=UPI001C24A794|nr:hypothetical protein [Nocardia alni]